MRLSLILSASSCLLPQHANALIPKDFHRADTSLNSGLIARAPQDPQQDQKVPEMNHLVITLYESFASKNVSLDSLHDSERYSWSLQGVSDVLTAQESAMFYISKDDQGIYALGMSEKTNPIESDSIITRIYVGELQEGTSFEKLEEILVEVKMPDEDDGPGSMVWTSNGLIAIEKAGNLAGIPLVRLLQEADLSASGLEQFWAPVFAYANDRYMDKYFGDLPADALMELRYNIGEFKTTPSDGVWKVIVSDDKALALDPQSPLAETFKTRIELRDAPQTHLFAALYNVRGLDYEKANKIWSDTQQSPFQWALVSSAASEETSQASIYQVVRLASPEDVFRYEFRAGASMSQLDDLIGAVDLGPLNKQATAAELAELLEGIDIADLAKEDSGCSIWACLAVQPLQREGYLAPENSFQMGELEMIGVGNALEQLRPKVVGEGNEDESVEDDDIGDDSDDEEDGQVFEDDQSNPGGDGGQVNTNTLRVRRDRMNNMLLRRAPSTCWKLTEQSSTRPKAIGPNGEGKIIQSSSKSLPSTAQKAIMPNARQISQPGMPKSLTGGESVAARPALKPPAFFNPASAAASVKSALGSSAIKPPTVRPPVVKPVGPPAIRPGAGSIIPSKGSPGVQLNKIFAERWITNKFYHYGLAAELKTITFNGELVWQHLTAKLSKIPTFYTRVLNIYGKMTSFYMKAGIALAPLALGSWFVSLGNAFYLHLPTTEKVAIGLSLLPVVGCIGTQVSKSLHGQGGSAADIAAYGLCVVADALMLTPAWPIGLLLKVAEVIIRFLSAPEEFDQEEMQKSYDEDWKATYDDIMHNVRENMQNESYSTQMDTELKAHMVAILYLGSHVATAVNQDLSDEERGGVFNFRGDMVLNLEMCRTFRARRAEIVAKTVKAFEAFIWQKQDNFIQRFKQQYIRKVALYRTTGFVNILNQGKVDPYMWAGAEIDSRPYFAALRELPDPFDPEAEKSFRDDVFASLKYEPDVCKESCQLRANDDSSPSCIWRSCYTDPQVAISKPMPEGLVATKMTEADLADDPYRLSCARVHQLHCGGSERAHVMESVLFEGALACVKPNNAEAEKKFQEANKEGSDGSEGGDPNEIEGDESEESKVQDADENTEDPKTKMEGGNPDKKGDMPPNIGFNDRTHRLKNTWIADGGDTIEADSDESNVI